MKNNPGVSHSCLAGSGTTGSKWVPKCAGPNFGWQPVCRGRKKSTGTELLYWAASRHRLFSYWPNSTCVHTYREGVSPHPRGRMVVREVVERKQGRTSVATMMPFITVLEFAYRRILFHKLPNFFMHTPKGIAAYISPWRPGGSEFSVLTFQRLGMRMARWNNCMMCWAFLLVRQRTYRSWAVISMLALGCCSRMT